MREFVHALVHASAATRAVVIGALIFVVIGGGLAADYEIATWRAEQAVGQSQQELCHIVDLVTANPVPYPANPKANPSRLQSYMFYEAFVTLGREYRC